MTPNNVYTILKTNLEEKGLKLDPELWTDMMEKSRVLTLEKSEILVKRGSKRKYVYFVSSGSLATFLFTIEGIKKAIWFHFDDLFNMAAAADSYYLNQPTKYEISAMEKSTVIRFSKQNFDLWILKYPLFNNFYIKGITYGRVVVQEARAQRLISTPEQYYYYLSEKFPTMVNRVSAKNMAYFLGVSPEWFSKLKKRMNNS